MISSATFKKWLKLLALWQHGTTDWPPTLLIENSTLCNRKCSYCPQTHDPLPERYMSWEMLDLVIHRLNESGYIGMLHWGWMGEPLMDARLPIMVKKVKDKTRFFNRQYLYTNGDFLTPEFAEFLMRQGINRFFISTHGRDPTELRDRFATFIPPEALRIVVMHEQEASVCNRGGAVTVNNPTPGMRTCNRDNYKICPIIAWNGDMMLCHNDYHRVHPVGNIADQSLRELWLGDYQKLRREMEGGYFRLPICHKCYVPEMGLTVQ